MGVEKKRLKKKKKKKEKRKKKQEKLGQTPRRWQKRFLSQTNNSVSMLNPLPINLWNDSFFISGWSGKRSRNDNSENSDDSEDSGDDEEGKGSRVCQCAKSLKC